MELFDFCLDHKDICAFSFFIDYRAKEQFDPERKKDMKKKLLCKVQPCDTSLHYQRLLLDVSDNPIALIRKKNFTVHDRWNVFMGDRKLESNKIYTTQTSNIIRSKSVHVFLANRASNKDGCDFKIKGSWANRNCTIYMGDTTAKLAKMSKMQSGSNNFMVTIYPNADYAFVVTLIAIVEAMENKDEGHVAEGTQAPGRTSGFLKQSAVSATISVVAQVVIGAFTS